MTPTHRPSAAKLAAGFIILFALYQSAEGVGARLLDNGLVANVLMLSALIAAPMVSRWLGFGWLGAYALDLKRGVGWIVLAGLVAAGAAKMLALLVGAQLGLYAIAPADAMAPQTALLAITGALIVTAVPSMAEDILTRGFWLRASGIRWTAAAFIFATSAIYLLNHIYRLGEGPIEWLRLLCFGLAFAAAAWRLKTLWAAFGLHWGWNLSNVLLDVFARVDTAAPAHGALISAGAHLVIAALILAMPARRSSDV
jgi:membrane protease YdiL (CAAX protease family)